MGSLTVHLLPSTTWAATVVPSEVFMKHIMDIMVFMPEPTDDAVGEAARCVEHGGTAMPQITVIVDRTGQNKVFLVDGIERLRGLQDMAIDDIPETILVAHMDMNGVQDHQIATIVATTVAIRLRQDRMLPIDIIEYCIELYETVCGNDDDMWKEMIKSSRLVYVQAQRQIVEKIFNQVMNADDNKRTNFEEFKGHARKSADVTRAAALKENQPPPASDNIFSWEMFRIAPQACALQDGAWREVNRKFRDAVGNGSRVTVACITEIIDKHAPGSIERRNPGRGRGRGRGGRGGGRGGARDLGALPRVFLEYLKVGSLVVVRVHHLIKNFLDDLSLRLHVDKPRTLDHLLRTATTCAQPSALRRRAWRPSTP
jgi:hypothetical protein